MVPSTNLSSTWDIYTYNSWSPLTNWANTIKTTQIIQTNSTFKLTVIDNEHGLVEFDKVNLIYEFKQTYESAELQICNTLGQCIYTQKIIENSGVIPIKTENMAKGLYYYALYLNQLLVHTGKLIKN